VYVATRAGFEVAIGGNTVAPWELEWVSNGGLGSLHDYNIT
jgi:hypothetical protein